MASVFDLNRFRELAFGRTELPDHPLQDTADAEKAVAELPQAPDAALGDLTRLAASMNATDSFSPGRRARVLMTLDVAARPLWRELARSYLAPHGTPSERKEGDANILRALFDAASEFANGFAVTLDTSDGEGDSKWVEENLGVLYLRNIRWLGRRLALSHMLNLGSIGAIWERTHRLHGMAEHRGVARSMLAAFQGDKVLSSVRQEYARMLIFELASPESMRGRHVELAFRIAGRMASAVRLEPAPSDETPFAVTPAGDARPGPRANYGPGLTPAPIYIATMPCLPRLRALHERDAGRDPAEPDTLFGTEYALRERTSMVNRLLDHWGADAPRRRGRRVSLASAARIVAGFDQAAQLVPTLEKARGAAEIRDLQLSIDETTRSLNRKKIQAHQQIGPARVVDASNGGVGLAIARRQAPWARHGILVALTIEPSTDWMVGVVRRVFSLGDELRLGIQILTRSPRTLSFTTETSVRDSVWEEAMKFEATFKERYRKGVLLESVGVPLTSGELILQPGLAARGTQLDVPLPGSIQRIVVARLLDENEHYQRVLFEPLEARTSS